MQILHVLHLYYISRDIFEHFCAFLGKNSACSLFFYILSQASEHFIYLFIFINFLGGGGGGWQLGGNLYIFKQILKIFMQLVVVPHLYYG